VASKQKSYDAVAKSPKTKRRDAITKKITPGQLARERAARAKKGMRG
jgi:hypothetical protein